MITHLKIKNFKSHKNTDLDLSKLSVFTGMNGCGKSSVIQSLLLLRQTYLKGRLMDGLDLNKPLCNIGIGNDALYRRATEGELSFEFFDTKNTQYDFSFLIDDKALNDSFLKRKEYSDTISNDNLKQLALFNNNFQYISASRWGGTSNFPKETYAAETQKQISLDYGQGELVAQFLDKFGEIDIMDYTFGEEKDLSLLNQTIFWERKISPKVTLQIESGKDNNSYTINYGYEGVEDIKPLMNLKAENIGYGISYALPVVVALLSASPGALILIENPEAHLHPSGQSQLAKLITMVANNGVQVIVETHSDHIITAIQLACKDHSKDKTKGVCNHDVSMYYFYNNEKNLLQRDKIEIKECGSIEYQPKGFFDQAEQDMFKLFSE